MIIAQQPWWRKKKGGGGRNLFAVFVLFLDFFGRLLHDGQLAVTHRLSCDRSLERRCVGRRVFLEGHRERVSLSSGGGGRPGLRARRLTLWTVACDTAAAFLGGIARSVGWGEREMR